MRLQWVDLDRFRNMGRQKVQLHPRYNLLLGRNGQGKTNFLEAVGYLGSLRSFRAAGRTEMIGHGESMCRVSGGVASEGMERTLAFALTRKGRTQFLDEQKVNSPEEYLQALKIVHFIPEDVGLVGGSPSWRRRVIDRSVFEVTPHYVTEYRRYLLVLRQRNALLRRGRASPAELKSWNQALASSGAILVERRQQLIRDLHPVMEELGERLGLGKGLGLTYIASHRGTDAGGGSQEDPAAGKEDPFTGPAQGGRSIENSILTSLSGLAEREARNGHTLAGPHRDNIIFTLGKENPNTDLARYGSQGQKRSAVLAFKLALAVIFHRMIGTWPLILLDDVASELDETKRKALGSIIRGTQAQCFISTTGEEYMFLPAEEGKVWMVEEGLLKPQK
ncbi:DNA replication and repair protein RecF [bacterium]|nr:DNA replication and repair protein RecF [bacterium]